MLLAGKGHENYQILRDRTFEFDDREKARAILRRRGFVEEGGLEAAVSTHRRVRQHRCALSAPCSLGPRVKPSSLETQCGGRLVKWLKLWVSRLPRALTPWPGWPASRLILARYSPENCSSPYTVRVTMDTIIVAAALARGAVAGVVARERVAQYPEEIRGKLFAVDDTLAALHQLASRACARWRSAKPGTADRRRGRLGRQNDHKRNLCGAGGRAVPRIEDRGQSEQRVRAAADAFANWTRSTMRR